MASTLLTTTGAGYAVFGNGQGQIVGSATRNVLYATVHAFRAEAVALQGRSPKWLPDALYHELTEAEMWLAPFDQAPANGDQLAAPADVSNVNKAIEVVVRARRSWRMRAVGVVVGIAAAGTLGVVLLKKRRK